MRLCAQVRSMHFFSKDGEGPIVQGDLFFFFQILRQFRCMKEYRWMFKIFQWIPLKLSLLPYSLKNLHDTGHSFKTITL